MRPCDPTKQQTVFSAFEMEFRGAGSAVPDTKLGLFAAASNNDPKKAKELIASKANINKLGPVRA